MRLVINSYYSKSVSGRTSGNSESCPYYDFKYIYLLFGIISMYDCQYNLLGLVFFSNTRESLGSTCHTKVMTRRCAVIQCGISGFGLQGKKAEVTSIKGMRQL